MPIERGIFDGEVRVVKDGRTDFSALQAELSSGRQQALVLYLFNLLFTSLPTSAACSCRSGQEFPKHRCRKPMGPCRIYRSIPKI
jgi:hypothetical protein